MWDWHPENTDYSEKANFGINAEILTTTVLAAPTVLGEFKVESKLLNPIIRNTEFTQYDEESLNAGWKDVYKRQIKCRAKCGVGEVDFSLVHSNSISAVSGEQP